MSWVDFVWRNVERKIFIEDIGVFRLVGVIFCGLFEELEICLVMLCGREILDFLN